MLNQAIPRLVVHLRSMFPDAKVELLIGENMPDHAHEPRPNSAPFRMSFSMRKQPEWLVVSETVPLSVSSHRTVAKVERGGVKTPPVQHDPQDIVALALGALAKFSSRSNSETAPRDSIKNGSLKPESGATIGEDPSGDATPHSNEESFQYIESSLLIRFPQLEHISSDAFLKLITFENQGLRGLTLLAGRGEREIIARTGFVAQSGLTLDETENLAIDVLSLLRFAKLLKDRITRSSVNGRFSYEMYHSQFMSVGQARNRYINYARKIFQGSTDRVFGQMQTMLRNDFGADATPGNTGVSRVLIPHISDKDRKFEFTLRVPNEVPMVTCDSPIMIHRAQSKKGSRVGMAVLSAVKMMELAARLNARPEIRTEPGHFEVSADGAYLTYTSWKHLTNDLHLFSLDYIVTAIARAEEILKTELQNMQLGQDISAKIAEPTAAAGTPPPTLRRRVA